MKKHKLEDRLFLMSPLKNGIGRYIPFCNYERHKGIITHNKHTVCEKRECRHYIRLYLSYKNFHEL